VSLIPIPARSLDIDHDMLHLLLQSPSVQFIYWQLSTSKQMLLQEHFGQDWRSLSPTLRFHEVGDPRIVLQSPRTDRVAELLLPPGESCFLSGLSAGQTYFATLGIRNEQGHFLPLLQSNTIQIPAMETNTSRHPASSDQPFVYLPTTIELTQVTPDAHEHFSAYSVYVPKNTYLVDMESGGDTD
jgi:hypothetical protein